MNTKTDNPYPQWIIEPVVHRFATEPDGRVVENPVYRAWAEGYSKGYANGQIAALKEHLEEVDRIHPLKGGEIR